MLNYDSQHRMVFYTRIQHGVPQVESRYLYEPLGRRTGKRMWRRMRDLTGWMSLSRKPEVTWYGWDGDRLTTIQTDQTRIQTVYQPGSFTPLIRIETENGELQKAQRRSLAEKLQQEGSEDGYGVVFPTELVRLLDRLEDKIRADRVSNESRQWLAQCGLTVEQLAIRRGARNMTSGETSLTRRTRITCSSHTACRDSSTMRSRGCTITGTGTMTRCWEGILPGSDWVEWRIKSIHVFPESY
ncbi:hypothetical protein G163CM_06360 [Pseudocitrobacter corydidari]|uniref:RHS repeat protein n=1 Tax=Pseudocitrobacter corydidari TaxID=2891570 RepID=A0ABY3RZS0_9ENTR|nr:hypothetical protein G163CM_06360 [Pseudocitrobacter corydidari]